MTLVARNVSAMIRWMRMIAACALAWALLDVANWAVRDCPTGPNSVDNCLWLRVQRLTGLPASKVLRAGVLEVVGLLILAGLWIVFRYLWPRRSAKPSESAAAAKS